MDKLHRNPAGGLIAACEIDDGCKKISCAMCLKEIPADAFRSGDVKDYVHHFCGLECFDAWQKLTQTPR